MLPLILHQIHLFLNHKKASALCALRCLTVQFLNVMQLCATEDQCTLQIKSQNNLCSSPFQYFFSNIYMLFPNILWIIKDPYVLVSNVSSYWPSQVILFIFLIFQARNKNCHFGINNRLNWNPKNERCLFNLSRAIYFDFWHLHNTLWPCFSLWMHSKMAAKW